MKLFISNVMPIYELFVLLCAIHCICGRVFGEEPYYTAGYYGNRAPYDKINAALAKLDNSLQWESDWPDSSIQMGQVSGVAIDNSGRVLAFHRAKNIWDAETFYDTNLYRGIGKPAIPEPTILVFNETGEVVDKWGENLFHIPHGIVVDHEDNVWVTDVAMHQVFKFTPNNKKKPAMTLGEKFVPGNDNTHFCKPTSVAVLPNGDFFVSDGYCNNRIIKYSPAGKIILQWGTNHGSSPYVFEVPHALTLAQDRGLLCTADRERGRVACFNYNNGTFDSQYRHWLIGGRLFSVAYAPVEGGRLYIVNGPSGPAPVRGYVIDMTSGRLIQTFAPNNGLRNPHDIAVSPDGSTAYVAEIIPFKLYKFVDGAMRNRSREHSDVTVPAKPTATVEVTGGSNSTAWEWWSGAAGGAGGAAAAALLALAALALRHARNTGKSVEAEPLVS